KVDLDNKEGVLAALASPNQAVRYMAMAQLQKEKLKEAHEVMKAAVAQEQNVWLRARGLWLLEWLKARSDSQSYRVGPDVLVLMASAYKSNDERFRQEYVRLVRHISPRLFSELSPQVRMMFSDDPFPA